MPVLVSINEAAARLGCKPMEVQRRIDAGLIAHVVLIDVDSLTEHQESHA